MSKAMEALKYNFSDYVPKLSTSNTKTSLFEDLENLKLSNKKKKQPKPKPFKYKGRKNRTINPEFVSLCKMSQEELKAHVEAELKKAYSKVISEDGFVYAKGTAPLLLTAHLDTVHYEPVKVFYEETKTEDGITKHILSSPQGIGGDDRCGVYIILQLVSAAKDPKKLPSVLFCEDEETGGEGSHKFVKTEYVEELKKLKFFVELDRRGDSDAVFYECGNLDFQDWIQEQTNYKENWGSFSDISVLSPATDVASVNLSVGYYKEHTLEETVVLEEMEHTKTVVQNLICKSRSRKRKAFDYQKEQYVYNNYSYGGYGGYGRYNQYTDWWDYYDESYMAETKKLQLEAEKQKMNFKYDDAITDWIGMDFVWYEKDKEGKQKIEYYQGSSRAECIGNFMFEHPDLCWNDIAECDVYDI